MTGPAGRFTEAATTAVMRRVAERIGVRYEGATLLRLTNNAVFALPAAGIVIRVTRSHGLAARVHKVVRLAGWFAQIAAPTIRLVSSIAQPIHESGMLATVWQYVPATPDPPAQAELGGVLRKFHQLGPPPFPLPAWNPVDDARRRLADAEALIPRHRATLVEWCDRLEPRLAAFSRSIMPGLVHGDAHAGNVVRTPEGCVLLTDFDSTCLGPWQVDLAAVAVGSIRFGNTGIHQALAAAYGYDVMTDPGWPLLREARELKMVSAALTYLESGSRVREQFELRLASAVDGGDSALWTPYADLRQ